MAKSTVSIPDELSLSECRERINELVIEMKKLRTEQAQVRERTGAIDRQASLMASEIALLEQRHDKLTAEPYVTDHAVLRYIERKYGFDIDAIRKEMLTPQVKAAMKVGAKGIKVDGGTFKLNGTAIVTYVRAK
ncbi:hypothetical protein ASD67_01905 [Sphingopyxis sp. Root1497]|uniref:hypothetical protein n=1 Tax=Sphingopyxis sp. Root1497 TaxID=1736474 RepID=UPI0006F862A8|nr:hypothetical protein [Sphingopyxis sp. Root1497]KQZ65868.1 hypothetical protein ASD67_01905 [Sphingopyxis sp. Root1497]OHD04554.1 MAG: hypothetical protein A2885_15045 [Sphingopyxis sp. RIFCSPHIGHO2_01_FULL_65_24]